MSKQKVLYIAAHSRSGSTILDRVLSQVEGGFSVGELRNIWLRSFGENQLCGCSNKFNECDIWKNIVDDSNLDKKYANQIHKLSRDVDRFKKIPQIWFPFLRDIQFNKKMNEYHAALETIYSSIENVVAPEFIIDSSKNSSYAMHLMNLDNIDLHVIHLVRDSRAVAFSRLRKKKRPEIHWKDEYMAVTPAYKTALQWNVMNYSMDIMKSRCSYSLVKYEDFMQEPTSTISNILADAGLHNKDLSFIKGRKINLAVDHTVSGNPMRFKVGDIELRSDDQWVSRLSKLNNNIVTLLTYFRLKKYGYL
ncbi:MAG: hypothetical protein DIZ80_12980 [endosymbiont of Galathealinum brachiosum]|uniref:Sulfotransferase family protein n=1 Tax=endosymbiont of Galathealinum brachiosum TaxID=2200906 RepID=A0A370D8X3_9GAMM|nr:MAG: hypothetical protein DIZ80_12980 [endosymbiont of Galathealinum brachiosum]